MNTALQLGVDWGSVRARIRDRGRITGNPGKASGKGPREDSDVRWIVDLRTPGGQRARASPGHTPRPCEVRSGALTQPQSRAPQLH
eukprot:9472126-Pyramimonas_sp.AAC.1